jgi:class 3 adenylate cyclase
MMVEQKPRESCLMFSDLVGSTALSARMDPEDLREVISAYQKCVARGGNAAHEAITVARRIHLVGRLCVTSQNNCNQWVLSF